MPQPQGCTGRARSAAIEPPSLALSLLMAALLWSAGAARADSGTGVDTLLGNALVPGRLGSGVDAKDPDGLGLTPHPRTPTGLLHADPWALTAPAAASDGWTYRASVEAGGLHVGGDRGNAKFGEYKSLKNGLYLLHAGVEAENAASALHFEVSGGGLGRDDQYVGVTFGRYNAWKVKAFYNETTHLFTSTYRNLWSGAGTGTLTLNNLPAGPVAPATAASTDIAIGNAALATPYSNLSIQRKKGGVRLEMTLDDGLSAFASLTSEKRQGTRPFGMVSAGGGGTGGVEIPETIDYDTHDLVGGLQWSNDRTSVNLQASASLFRNNTGTLSVDNPLFLAPANGINSFPRAVFDLYPDNELYGVKAELAHSIPEWMRARFTGVVSFNSSRQNDALIPWTPYAGLTVNGVPGGAWDTTGSLNRTTAGQRIDTRLVDLGLAFAPANSVDVRAKLRHYQTSNDGAVFWACNPITGQWARVINDGSNALPVVPNATTGNNPAGTPTTAYDAARCNVAAVQAQGLVPTAGNINIRNVPYEYRQTNARLGADWRVMRDRSLSLDVEREQFDREHRERDRTWEDRIKLGYVDRSFVAGTLRASFEQARRRGSDYVSDPYDEFTSGSFGPLPTAAGTNVTAWIHVNDLHRKFDLADRDSATLNLRYNRALRDDVDLALVLQAKDQRYPNSAYGRSGHWRQNSANLDVNWQPAPDTQVWGYASWQSGRISQVGVQQNACVLGSTYYLFSDGSMATSPTPTAAQNAAGIGVVGNSGVVTAANFLQLCGHASDTSPLYPTSRNWTATQGDTNQGLGIGARRDFGRVRVEGSYGVNHGRTSVNYSYNAAGLGLVTSGAATATQLATLALIGSGMPDLVYRQDTFDASVLFPVNKSLALRVMLRHEVGKIRDWHYDGVAANPTPSNNQQTYLDSGPQDWRVTAVGAFVQITW